MPRLIVGDETGLVKCIQVRGKMHKVSEVHGLETQSRERSVVDLCFDEGGGDDCLVWLARRTGVVESWRVKSKHGGSSLVMEGSSNAASTSAGNGDGVDCGASADPAPEMVGIACVSQGKYVCCFANGKARVKGTAVTGKACSSSLWPVGGHVGAMCAGEGVFATGGKENDVKLWDVQEQTCIWKAKNVPPDRKLQLRVPVWVSSLRPLSADGDIRTLLCGTAHRHIRIYDTRTKRRPVKSISYGDHRIMSMQIAPSGNEAIIADCSGLVTSLDLRKMAQRIRYVGPAGSVRSIAVHGETVACVGLDRYCRIYNISSSLNLHNIYLKQRLNSVAFVPRDLDESDLTQAGVDDSGDGADESFGEEREGDYDSWGSGAEYDMDVNSSSQDEGDESSSGEEDNEEDKRKRSRRN